MPRATGWCLKLSRHWYGWSLLACLLLFVLIHPVISDANGLSVRKLGDGLTGFGVNTAKVDPMAYAKKVFISYAAMYEDIGSSRLHVGKQLWGQLKNLSGARSLLINRNIESKEVSLRAKQDSDSAMHCWMSSSRCVNKRRGILSVHYGGRSNQFHMHRWGLTPIDYSRRKGHFVVNLPLKIATLNAYPRPLIQVK